MVHVLGSTGTADVAIIPGDCIDLLRNAAHPLKRLVDRHFGKMPARKSLGGECSRSGRNVFCSCTFSRRPFHQAASALADAVPNWLAENGVMLANGNASSPLDAEPDLPPFARYGADST